ncbi:T9SS type A sorting domain-containing protein [Pseudoflavitalea sp. G-6-1-2]|uniref:T9SS type A sorting domain-containing protein n=1 Tax=Pseudoflavitalea sp. G-6-1-2 TaxID=2728841 RepID=UPI00146BB110|nr:T9SS type A sorting domain-containing protein [Pseudoflavitalea sp. G-6-1-2]NML22555.1 T9SS type A sorting domain-containing protein [Pseudoflavitalea sp. G-6-1-2]
MRIIQIMLALLSTGYASVAQQIVVGNGQLVINAGTQFSFNGLLFNPTSPVTLTNTSANRNATVTNTFTDPYVSRVFLIAPSPFLFSGNIRFPYADSELNGLAESTLKVVSWNGSAWQLAGTSTPDATNNFVDATGLTNLPVNELILAASAALPLQWVSVSASRKEDAVNIQWITEQEYQVSHFDVERSTNAQQWTVAAARIPATNQSNRSTYQHTDRPGYAGTLYYRIRQTDLDGRQTISKIVLVAPGRLSNQMTILPNPAKSYFSIAGVASGNVVQVSVFTSGGMMVKTWKGYQEQYHLTSVPAGTYLVRIKTADGKETSSQLLIR